MKKVMFISSTGGHLSELLQLQKIFNKYDYHIITENTEISKNLNDIYKGKVFLLKYGNKHNILRYIWVFPFNIVRSLFIFSKTRPDVIVTTGAHTAVPMCYIAKIFRRKIIYIETFANIHTKTMTGRIIYPIADVFIVQWESMLKLYPKAEYRGWIY